MRLPRLCLLLSALVGGAMVPPTVWMCMCPVLYRSEIHQSPKTCTVEPYEHQATNIVWVEEVDIPINQPINTQKTSCYVHVLFNYIYLCMHTFHKDVHVLCISMVFERFFWRKSAQAATLGLPQSLPGYVPLRPGLPWAQQ